MAAMSAASGTATYDTSNAPRDEFSGWKYGHDEDIYEAGHSTKDVLGTRNGIENSEYDPYAAESYPATRGGRSSSRATTSHPENKRPNGDYLFDDESSKWIHRDKLAKIENEELQAAGIVLPKPRSQSRPRRDRDRSQDKVNGHRRGTDASEQQPLPRSRKNSELSHDKSPEFEVPSWDLRLPEEIAEDPGEYFVPPESSKGSRIPVAKLSPAPIPVDYLDRDAPAQRKPSFSLLDEETTIALPKGRSRSSSVANTLDDTLKVQPGKRSVTNGSPKKSSTNARKASTTKPNTPGRPKTRSGSAPRNASSTRPTTRSGEISPRAPEGDPPWMVSAYKPDPRLPPDQQLLPTVAKRLQQEKWEAEGKFGNVYDKEFRPLNEDTPTRPPELEKPAEIEQSQDEWPLRAEATRPATLSRPGTSSYSTMPKIQDQPIPSPLASPRLMQQQQLQQLPPQSSTQAHVAEGPDPSEQPQEKPKRAGCGCCIVM